MHSALNGKFASEKEAALSLFEAMKKDKKNASNKVRFVLQEDVGETVITEVDEKDVLSVL